MQIHTNLNSNYNKQPTFQARNPEIRFAQSILRKLDNEFPRISTTKRTIIFERHSKPLSNKLIRLKDKLYEYRERGFGCQGLDYFKNVLEYVKNQKLGNCGESAYLSHLGLELNGVENLTYCHLNGYKSKGQIDECVNLDHAFVIVNLAKNANPKDYRTFGKKAYVVDAWSNFVEYASIAFKRFAQENEPVFKTDNKTSTLGIQAIKFETDPRMLDYIPELRVRKNNV